MKKSTPQPPSWALAFLRWFVRPDLADEIEGDLREEFEARVRSGRTLSAKFMFVIGVFSFLKPFAFGKGASVGGFFMMKSYLQVAWRGAVRHKLFSVINIAGLAFSMSVGLIVIALISDLARFDSFHVNKDRIWRVISEVHAPARPVDEKATVPMPLAEKLMSTAGVEAVVRINKGIFDNIEVGTLGVSVEGYFTDPDFLKVFSFKLVKGNPATALSSPTSIILTTSTAIKVFKTDDVVGRTINMKSFGQFTVTGVIEDPPKQSHLQFDVLVSFTAVAPLERDDKLYATLDHWDRTNRNYIYFLLGEHQDTGSIQSILDDVSRQMYPNKEAWHASFELQALLDIVPGRNLSTQIGPKMMYLPMIILTALAGVIILSACFNYTNLSIARSLRRAKEVGLRKISGARRREIVWQFLLESVMLSVFSLVAALWVFTVIRPHFLENAPMLQKIVDLHLTPTLLIWFTVFAIGVGIVAGLLPAMLFSSMRIMDGLKNLKNVSLVGTLGIRKALIIFQFTLSLFLITGIGIIYRQYDFSVNRELGFERENILAVELQGMKPDKIVPAWQQLKDVASISFSSHLLGTSESRQSLTVLNENKDSVYVHSLSADREFIENVSLRFVAGGNFPDSIRGDGEQFAIINRQFLKLLKTDIPADALDQVIKCDGHDLQIIGVTEDFNYLQLEDPIKSFVIRRDPKTFEIASLKLYSMNLSETLMQVERAWKAASPEAEFMGRFYDDEIQETYSFYVKLIRLFGYIGLLAISIAALGLLGMATYTAETRRKEIGIRKVLGAKEFQIVVLLSRSFVVMLGIAAMIALPATYLLFDNVILELSAYRISIGPLELGTGVFITSLVGGLSIVSQTWNAAKVNPVKMLREE